MQAEVLFLEDHSPRGTEDTAEFLGKYLRYLSASDLRGAVDFTAAFYVVHEFPDHGTFFAEVAEASKPGACVLLAEPKGHVKAAAFEAELEAAAKAGFSVAGRPNIQRSLTALLKKM